MLKDFTAEKVYTVDSSEDISEELDLQLFMWLTYMHTCKYERCA